MKKIWMPILAIILFFFASVLFTFAMLTDRDEKKTDITYSLAPLAAVTKGALC